MQELKLCDPSKGATATILPHSCVRDGFSSSTSSGRCTEIPYTSNNSHFPTFMTSQSASNNNCIFPLSDSLSFSSEEYYHCTRAHHNAWHCQQLWPLNNIHSHMACSSSLLTAAEYIFNDIRRRMFTVLILCCPFTLLSSMLHHRYMMMVVLL